MPFLPDGYKVPTNSKYMKLQKGKNKFRVLDSAIVGYEWWEDTEEGGRKPFRVKSFGEAVATGKEPIKHFWAFPIWNYEENMVQILELTQKTIQSAITSIVDNEDWGSPQDYDLTITKKGDGFDTEYDIVPSPKKSISPEIAQAWKETKLNLNALFDGADPFSTDIDLDEIDEALS